MQQQGGHTERVKIGDAEFFVQVVDAGAGVVGTRPVLSFDGVRQTVEAIAGEMTGVWNRVKPSEASVEFGLALTARTGKLTGLVVDADGAASLKIVLTWKAPETAPEEK